MQIFSFLTEKSKKFSKFRNFAEIFTKFKNYNFFQRFGVEIIELNRFGLYLLYKKTEFLSVKKYFQNCGAHFQKFISQSFFKIMKQTKILNSS
jgi:hypothetical protein